MQANTAEKLLALNRQFYQTRALQFSSTRKRLQPGVRRVMERLPPTTRLLDLGCGNGELARQLARSGHSGEYVGLDFSQPLLEQAALGLPADFPARFLAVDLSTPGWENQVPAAPFDLACAFAVMHHLPGEELRLQVLRGVHRLLPQGGLFIHSEWQFLNSPRLRGRVLPWLQAGLEAEQVDEGDYLLDWKHGAYGLRYAHHFNPAELDRLAAASGYRVMESFTSDGEGGNLGLYQIWKTL